MNIYFNKDRKIYHCSTDSCPDGWELLGEDNTLTNENKVYVIGFEDGKAILDTETILRFAREKEKRNIFLQLQEIDMKSIRAICTYLCNENEVEKEILKKYEYEKMELRQKLKNLN